jgi:outer membrane protein assembly factor BamB
MKQCRIAFSVVFLLLASAFPRLVTAENWPMLAHDQQHTGSTGDALALPLSLNGSLAIDGSTMFLSSPVVEGCVAYLAGFRHGTCMKAYDMCTGTLLWEFCDNDRDLETACVYGDYVYVSADYNLSSGSRLYKLDRTTGAMLQYVEVPGQPEPACVVNGTIYVGYGHYWSGPYGLIALDAETLATIWNYSNPAGHGCSQPAVSEDGSLLYTSDGGGSLRCLNSTTGIEIWAFSSGIPWGVNSPCVSGSSVYFVAGCENVNAYALASADGSLLWSKHLAGAGCQSQTQAVHNDVLYVSADKTLYALDGSDEGNTLWTFRADGGCQAPSIASDVVFVPTDGAGGVYALDAPTGSVQWSYSCPGTVPQLAAPAIASGHLLFYYYDATATVTTLYDFVSAQPNQPPVANDDDFGARSGIPLLVAGPGVFRNDSDADADQLTAVLVSDVSNGTLTLNPDGSFLYQSVSGFSGIDQFAYFANDGSANSASAAVVSLHVKGTGAIAPGDYNEDAVWTEFDLTALIDAIFSNGPDPADGGCRIWPRGDLDCDGFSTPLDLPRLVDYLYAGGIAPCDPCQQ